MKYLKTNDLIDILKFCGGSQGHECIWDKFDIASVINKFGDDYKIIDGELKMIKDNSKYRKRFLNFII